MSWRQRMRRRLIWAGALLGLAVVLATVSVLRVGMAGRRTMRKWITPSTPVTGSGVNLLVSKWVPIR